MDNRCLELQPHRGHGEDYDSKVHCSKVPQRNLHVSRSLTQSGWKMAQFFGNPFAVINNKRVARELVSANMPAEGCSGRGDVLLQRTRSVVLKANTAGAL